MKRIVACFLVLAVCPSYSATFPTDKGSFIAGGSASFVRASGDLYKINDKASTNLTIMPTVGYFIVPGLNVGVVASFLKSTQGVESEGHAGFKNENTFGIGPEVIYYFGGSTKPKLIKSKTYPYLNAQFMIQSSKQKFTWEADPIIQSTGTSVENSTQEYKTTYHSYFFGAGVTHMLTQSVGLTALVLYEIDKMKFEEEKAVNGNQIKILIGLTSFIY